MPELKQLPGLPDLNAVNANWLLATPESYATENQIATKRKLAEHLLSQQGSRNGGMQFGPPDKAYGWHPSMGIANIVATLMGVNQQREAAIAEQRMQRDERGNFPVPATTPPVNPGTPPTVWPVNPLARPRQE